MFKLRICGFWMVLILFLFSCKRNTEKYAFYINSSENSDLSAIVANKKLIVLAENSATSYVELEGVKMGFEYELLKEYAKSIGVKLEVKLISNLDDEVLSTNNIPTKGKIGIRYLTIAPITGVISPINNDAIRIKNNPSKNKFE